MGGIGGTFWYEAVGGKMLVDVLSEWVKGELVRMKTTKDFQRAIAAVCPSDLKPPTTQAIEKWRDKTVKSLKLESISAIALYRGWSVPQVNEWLRTGKEPIEPEPIPPMPFDQLSVTRIAAHLNLIKAWCNEPDRAIAILPYVIRLCCDLSEDALDARVDAISFLFVREFERKGLSVNNPADVDWFLAETEPKLAERLRSVIAGKSQLTQNDAVPLRSLLLFRFGTDIPINLLLDMIGRVDGVEVIE
jgi:hypothetical protein